MGIYPDRLLRGSGQNDDIPRAACGKSGGGGFQGTVAGMRIYKTQKLSRRPVVEPATDWERDRLQKLYDGGAIHDTVINDGTIEQLTNRVGFFANTVDPYLQTR